MSFDFFTQLSIVIAIGAAISLVMRLIKQPLIIGYILTGLIVGPFVLNIFNQNQTVEVFSSIGVALLLFIIGLGLNPRVVREVGKVAAIAGIVQIVFTVIVSYFVGTTLGYNKTESVFIGLALAFSSTIIVLKLLSDKKEQNRLYGKITIGILLIQDIVHATALVLVASRSESSFSLSTLTAFIGKGLLIAIPMFLISYLVLPKMSRIIAGSQEFLFLFAIGWGFGAAALFEHFGFSIEVGALFAGVALANLPYVQEIASRLRPLRDFFIIVFFITLGAQLNLNGFNSLWFPVLIFSFIVIIIKPLVTLGIMGILGYTKSTSFKTSSAIAQVSEFSLVLVIFGVHQGMIGGQIADIMIIVAFITMTYSAYAITYSSKFYGLFERYLTLFERRKTKQEISKPQHYDMVLFGYKKGGSEFIKVMEQMKKKFVVVDYDPDVVDIMINQNVDFVYGDVTDIELLNEVHLAHAKMVVSTIGDHPTNIFLARWLERINQNAVYVCAAENAQQASELYEEGVSYVMMPHYIGSEKISSFIKKNGFNKIEFRRFREKHLQYLQSHYSQRQ